MLSVLTHESDLRSRWGSVGVLDCGLFVHGGLSITREQSAMAIFKRLSTAGHVTIQICLLNSFDCSLRNERRKLTSISS